ncbi:MAG: hypothetical protein DDG59_10115, partial [Anaerolineae bacterium]
SNPAAVLVAQSPVSPRFNYLIGNDRSRWVTNVPAYSGLVYHELYPGLDLEISFQAGGLSWSFNSNEEGAKRTLAKPHLRLEGGEDIRVSEERSLSFSTSIGRIALTLPSAPYGMEISWESADGVEQEATLKPSGDRRLYAEQNMLRIGKLANIKQEFLSLRTAFGQENLDEVVLSTYLGGSGEEIAYDVAVDSAGYIYVVGTTTSVDFPGVIGDFDSQPNGNQYVFISKLSPDASSLVYSTYLGGNNIDRGYALELNPDGQAVVVGVTTSTDFPRTYGTAGGNGDGFVFRLSAQGDQMEFSHLMGGGGFEAIHDLVIDGNGNLYVTGETQSNDFPIGYGHLGGKDGFVVKLPSTGDVLSSVGLLSGSADDIGYGVDLGPENEVVVVGSTTSQNFPVTQSAFSTQYNGGEADGFISFFEMQDYTASLVYSTYFGGNGWDEIFDIEQQGGFSFLTGFSASSTNFPLASAYQASFGGVFDAFVAKFDRTWGLTFSTYLGGSNVDIGRAVVVSSAGEPLIAGNTSSNDFPTTSSALYPSPRGGDDGFVSKLSSEGSQLIYSTYFGGSGSDRGRGITLGNDPRPYVVGDTGSDKLLLSDSAVDQQFQEQEAFLLLLAMGFYPTPTPLPTASATLTSTETKTPLPSKTATSTRTVTPTRMQTPTRTASPTRTLTPTRTERPTMTMVPTSTYPPSLFHFQLFIPWIVLRDEAPAD